MSPTKAPLSHESRLHAAYLRLTFKHWATDQDARREQLFRRLVLHHLLAHVMYTLSDWHDLAAQQTCVFNFLRDYAHQLWPGSKAQRLHLADPELAPRNKRSFVGAIDSHWSQRRNGSETKRSGKGKIGGGGQATDVQIGFDHRSEIGGRALSKIGKALTRYVDILLERAIEHAEFEDTARLIEGILATKMGPDIEPVECMEEVTVKIEEDSD